MSSRYTSASSHLKKKGHDDSKVTQGPNIKLTETVKKAYAYTHNKLMKDIKDDIEATITIIKT